MTARYLLTLATLGLLVPVTLQLRPFIARELAAFELASYNAGFQDGFIAGAGRNKPDGRIGVRP